MKSDKHRWKEIAKGQKRGRKLSDDGPVHGQDKHGPSRRSDWKRQQHQLMEMDISDLEQYILDTEHDPE